LFKWLKNQLQFGRVNSCATRSNPKISRKIDLTTDKKTWTRQNFGFEIGASKGLRQS
jgi:hypothetical protein